MPVTYSVDLRFAGEGQRSTTKGRVESLDRDSPVKSESGVKSQDRNSPTKMSDTHGRGWESVSAYSLAGDMVPDSAARQEPADVFRNLAVPIHPVNPTGWRSQCMRTVCLQVSQRGSAVVGQ